MKKFSLLLVVIAIFSMFTFFGCSKQELVISQDIWLYNIGQEIENNDFSVALAGGDDSISLDSSLYSFDSNFDSKKEGVYNLNFKYKDIETATRVVVIDYDRLNLYVGQSLEEIVLPENVYFENSNKIYTSTGIYTEKLCFNDNGIVKETAVSIEISQNQNEWIVYPSMNNWTYGESPSVVNAQSKFGKIEYSYYTLDDEYYLKAEVAATDSYTSLSALVRFTIERAEVEINPCVREVTKIYDSTYEYTGDISSLVEFSSTIDNVKDYLKLTDAYFVNANYEKDCNVGDKLLLLEFELVNNENLTFSGKNTTIFSIKAQIISQTPNILSNPKSSQAVYGQQLSTIALTEGVVKAYLYQNSQSTLCQIEGEWSFDKPLTILKDSGLYDIIFTPKDKNISKVTTQIYLEVVLNLNIDVTIDQTELSYSQQGDEIYIELPKENSLCTIEFNNLIDLDCDYLVYYDNEYQNKYEDYATFTVNISDLEIINLITLKVKLFEEKTAYFTIYIELEQPVKMYVNGQRQNLTDSVNVGDKLTFKTSNEKIKVYIEGMEITGEYEVPQYYSSGVIFLEANGYIYSIIHLNIFIL